MSVITPVSEFVKFFGNLTATSPVCTSLGNTLVQGSNLFMVVEPSEATQCITAIPYGSTPPRSKDKYESNVQIRVKATSNKRALETTQAIINTLHENCNVCASNNGIVLANQSNPIFLPAMEGGEFSIAVSNYLVRHVKF